MTNVVLHIANSQNVSSWRRNLEKGYDCLLRFYSEKNQPNSEHEKILKDDFRMKYAFIEVVRVFF